MFYKKIYEERLKVWHEFRKQLELVDDPIQKAIDTYNNIPNGNLCTDPYNPEVWPTPWELINDNQYCAFTKLLAICYSLQLTERFLEEEFRIHIFIDRNRSNQYYLLAIGQTVIGFDNYRDIKYFEMPNDCQSLLAHTMPMIN
jgi:hypothetical protein